MNKKNFLLPEEDPKNPAYNFKNVVMDNVENSNLFKSYIKNNTSYKLNENSLYIFHTISTFTNVN